MCSSKGRVNEASHREASGRSNLSLGRASICEKHSHENPGLQQIAQPLEKFSQVFSKACRSLGKLAELTAIMPAIRPDFGRRSTAVPHAQPCLARA
jgi:hypothetical protein